MIMLFEAGQRGARHPVCPTAAASQSSHESHHRIARGLIATVTLLTLTLGITSYSYGAFPLVGSGRAAPIFVMRDAPEPVVAAVEEFVRFVSESTGIAPEARYVRSPIDPDKRDVYGIAVGRAAALEATESELGPDGYRILTTDRLIRLTGPTPAGTANALYDLLETAIGVRFLVPGDDGIVIPTLRDVVVQTSDRRERPAFIHRAPWFNTDVMRGYSDERRLEMAAFVRRNRGRGIDAEIGHYFARLIPPDREFETHPEYFAEVQGQRIPHGQLCTSNEDVARITVEHWTKRFDRQPELRIGSLTPNDGGLYCECAQCALVHGDTGERLVAYMNAATARITAAHPDRLMTFYAYGPLTAPVTTTLHPKLMPAVTRYLICQAHDMETAECPSNTIFRNQVDGWLGVSDQFFVREFACWWHAPDLGIGVLTRNLRAYARLGAVGISREYLSRTFGSDLMRYVDLRLMWDPSQNPEQLVDNFMSARYGPAASGMRAVVDRFRTRLEATPVSQEVRANELEIDQVYDITMLEEAVAELEALAASTNDVYRIRVQNDAALLRASLYFRQVTELRKRYSVTGKPEDLEALLETIDAAVEHCTRYEAAGLLGGLFVHDIEKTRARVAGAGLRAPISGGFDYRDDLEHGGLSRRDAIRVTGFYAGQYGLALLPGREGIVEYTLTAASGTRFMKMELTRLAFHGSRSHIEVVAGGRSRILGKNERFSDVQFTYDISDVTAGSTEVTIRFWAANDRDRPMLCLDGWGVRGHTQ